MPVWDAEPVALAVPDPEEDALCDGDTELLDVLVWETVPESEGVIVADPDTDWLAEPLDESVADGVCD